LFKGSLSPAVDRRQNGREDDTDEHPHAADTNGLAEYMTVPEVGDHRATLRVELQSSRFTG
jgi:hypothetical protein